MFYSHEILTSHKYGVATVWLVATLGAKSALKKVNRKDILNVNVPKACNTIIAPDAPMALRLQSNLLYGVSRVYAQQCGYVLADAQHAHNTMRTLLKVVKTAQLDSDANKARLDQLILPDDPAFAPELEISLAPPPLDSELSLHAASWDATSLLPATSSEKGAPRTPQKRKATLTKDGRLTTELALAAPSSTADALAAGPRDLLGSALMDTHERLVLGGHDGVGLGDGDDGFLPDAGFEFDIDGNLIDLSSDGAILQGSDAALSAQVRLDHEEARRAAELASTGMRQAHVESDSALPDYDQYNGLSHAQAFPRNGYSEIAAVDSSSFAPIEGISTDPATAATTEGAAAFNRRKPTRHRKRRILQLDERIQLRNTELAENNANYLANMAVATEHKRQLKAARQAKENARFWVWGSGIGGVGAEIGSGIGLACVKSPLTMFCGDKLKAELLGISMDELTTGLTSRKHSRESEEPDENISDVEGRRVRSRGEEEGGSRFGIGYGDDGVNIAGYDDAIEIPREAPSQIDDISSAMPWNRSASIRGSSVPHSIFRTGATIGGSASGLSASRRLHPSSRLVSASPLQGRGLGVRGSHSRGFSDLGLPRDEEMLGADLPDFDETELYGIETEAAAAAAAAATAAVLPVAQMGDRPAIAGTGADTGPSTIPRSESRQLPQAHLDRDAFNFLAFVEDAILSRRQGLETEGPGEEEKEEEAGMDPTAAATGTGTITLEALLPPRENSATVAAQGLLHTLTLASRNVLRVWQKEPFGEIRMGLTMGAAVGAEGEE